MEKALLKIRSGPLAGKAFPVARRSVKIGRGSGCDIRPSGYDEISREHARLTWEGGSFHIADLGSRNGVKVDGQKVSTSRLRSGDTIQIGDMAAELWIPPGGPAFDDASAPAPPVPPAPAPRPTVLSPALMGVFALVAVVILIAVASAFRHKHSFGGGGTAVAGGNTSSDDTTAPSNGELASDILTTSKASTVMVIAKNPQTGQPVGQGSGFCAFHKNWIITNEHVVAVPVNDNGQEGEVAGDMVVVINGGTNDEKIVQGVVAMVDSEHDLAIIRLEGASLTPLPMGDAGALHETQTCYAFGFPAVHTSDIRQDAPAVSVQPVTVESLRFDDLNHIQKIQLGGTVTHGNSGGPVINADGQVVGVVREAARDPGMTAVDPQTAAGISYAIPSHFVVNLQKKVESDD